MVDRTVTYRLQADITQFRAQMSAAGASVGKAANDMTAATKQGAAFRQGLDSLGGTAGKVGLVAAVGLGAAIKKAADFEQAMSNVSAATGESAANMDKLRQAALDAGAQTAFSATEAAAGVEQLAKAGVATADILNGGLMGALDLAAAGELAVGDAAEIAAKAMTQFGLAGDQVPHIADLLASAAGNASGEVSDFGMALSQAGLVANQVGLSIEETTGGLAAFASAGLLGSDAGTSMKAALAALTPNSTKAARVMSELGISAFDAQGEFIGLAEFSGVLQTSLADMTDQQRQATLETIFGSDAVRAASVLYEQGEEGIRKWVDTVDDQGAAAEMAGEKLNNLKGDLEALGGSLETALIGTGDSSQGPLRSLTQSLTDTVNAYNNLGDGAKSGVAVTLAATAALGGGLFVFSKMVQGIAATRVAMTQLGLSATATSRLMAGVGKAGFGLAGLAAAGMAIDAVRKSLDETLPGMSTLTGQIIAISEGKVTSLGSEFDSLASSIDRLADPGYIYESSDAILGLLTLGQVDGAEVDGARQEIDALDEALTNLASTGGSAAASRAFDDLAEAQGLSAAETKTLLTLLPGYTEALAANENQAVLAGKATAGFGYESSAAAGKAKQSAAQIEAQAEALKEARDAARQTAGSFVNLGDALNDGKKSLGEWIRQMSNQADALNNFTTNSQKAAKRGLRDGLIAALQDAGTEGALRMKQLANATDAEIDRANAAWSKGQGAIDRYVKATTKVPTNISTKVDVDNRMALASFREVDQMMSNLNGRVATTYVRTVNQGGMGPQERAQGGPIFGPGTATSDSIPALLSNGEYVVKAAAVEHYGMGFFDRANAMRLAEGGKVDKKKRPKRNLEQEGDTAVDMSGMVRAASAQLDAAVAQQQAADRALNAAEIAALAAKDQDEAADKALDAAQALYDGIKSQTAGLFNIDPLARPSSAWMPGGDPFSSLQDVINRTSAFSAGSSALAGRGLDGAALAYGLGSEDRLGMLSAMSDEDLQKFEDMFNQASAGVANAATVAADLTYGQQVASAVATAANTEAVLQQSLAQQQYQTDILAGVEARVGELASRLDGFAQTVGQSAASGVVYGGNAVARRGTGVGRNGR